MRHTGWMTSVLGFAAVIGCAFDSATESTGPWQGASSGVAESSESGDATSTETDATSCSAPCNAPPGDCFEQAGECVDGTCVYPPALAGILCTDDCDNGGICETTGVCICNEGPGDCEQTCTAGPNATATCTDQGECEIACVAPWEDCDGEPANGCEVPVGVPHQCDAQGLNPDGGCWTAYCGSASGPNTFDFETYHCVDCPTCRQPGGGQCQWCNHETGHFYPTDSCSCESDLDAACMAPG